MHDTNTAELHAGPDECLLILADGGQSISDQFTTVITCPAYTARWHADDVIRARGLTRTGEWVRDEWGFLTAPYAALADVDADTAARYAPAEPIRATTHN